MAGTPDYGRRLIITVVDEVARDAPERVVYSLAKSEDISKGLRDVTARDFANAINRTAWWLESELGRGTNFPSVGFIAPCKFSACPVAVPGLRRAQTAISGTSSSSWAL